MTFKIDFYAALKRSDCTTMDGYRVRDHRSEGGKTIVHVPNSPQKVFYRFTEQEVEVNTVGSADVTDTDGNVHDFVFICYVFLKEEHVTGVSSSQDSIGLHAALEKSKFTTLDSYEVSGYSTRDNKVTVETASCESEKSSLFHDQLVEFSLTGRALITDTDGGVHELIVDFMATCQRKLQSKGAEK